MAQVGLATSLGDLQLRSPLVAASGTVGSVWEWAKVADVSHYGAAVAKSVAASPWSGRPAPRMAPTDVGMLNGIGIQNPGIDHWAQTVGPRLQKIGVPVWGSAVGGDPAEFAKVAGRLEGAGVAAIEVNLSCPNLDDGTMFAFCPSRSADVISEVTGVTQVPIGAKLSPNTPDISGVASACIDAGASFLTLTNTALGFGIDRKLKRPLLSGAVGGYSGPGLKPMALRCVYEVAQALPGTPIVGCGGVRNAEDVIDYLMAGASAVAIGTALLARPNVGARVVRRLPRLLDRLGFASVPEAVGTVEEW